MSVKASQIWDWLATTLGGFRKMAAVCPRGLIITHLSLWYTPRSVPGGGVNENISPGSVTYFTL